MGFTVESIKEKAMVVGYTRMLRRTIKREPDNKALIDHSLKQLIQYVNKVDSLTY